jgi:3-ketosteroid 9alpha-monooxygenase subunit A
LRNSRRSRSEGFPKGWFVIGFSDEYEPGQVQKLQYFDEALVAYRGAGGTLYVLDGYCPHLGANLGVGGTVEGECIRCPFHRWKFGADGLCVEIPYSEAPIPKKARLRSWEVRERDGMIYLWYHPEGGGPEFDPPDLGLDAALSPWSPWRHHKIRIATHSREIVENVVDIAHFSSVHGTEIDFFENRFEGVRAIQRNRGIAYPRGGGKDRFELEATYYGPGVQISEMRGVLASRLVNAHTMVDAGSLDLRFAVSLRRGGDDARLEALADRYIANLTTGFLEDVAIWENKVFRSTPVLCADDGPIIKLRRWYEQFFAPF